MKTIAIQIGNSDNKLTQTEWAKFVNETHSSIVRWCDDIHFSAPSIGWADWQNAAWILSCKEAYLINLKAEVEIIRKKYKQNSLAWLEGETEFI